MFCDIATPCSSTYFWLNNIRHDGRGFIFTLKNNQPRNIVFDSHDDALLKIDELVSEGNDVFLSVGNMLENATSRSSENITDLKSLFIDLDCGPNKHFIDQKDALVRLNTVLEATGFPHPSVVVNSGGGIHAYWCFDIPIPKDDWLALAHKFKQFWLSHGLQIDPVVTADCSRVMRVPGSKNHKIEGNIRPVSMLLPKEGQATQKYSLEEIVKALPDITPLPTSQREYDMSEPRDWGVKNTQNDSSGYLIAERCKQIEHVLKTGGENRSEPEWRADLGLLKFCKEAPAILIKASAQHPKYSIFETNQKAEKWATNPTTCQHYFNILGSELCDGCGYQGRITSPIQLGYPTPRGLKTILNQAPAPAPTTPAPYLSAPPEILEVSKKFAWDKNEMNIYNLKTGRYVQKDRFNTHYANKFIDLGTSQKPRPVALGQAWLQHALRREANGIRLAPNEPEDLPDGAINSWLGFSTVPIKGDIKPFIQLFKRQIPNRHDREYVLHWIANLLQNPASKAYTSIVMWSRIQGTGKNLIWECVGNLFNERHFTLVSQEVFDDAFTEWKANRVFVICDEVSSTERRSTADRIKGWITSSSNSINAKNEPKFTQPNLIKYVFLSNHPDAVFLDDSDRRFFVIEVQQGRLPEAEAQAFTKWRDNGGKEALLYFLLNLDIGDFNSMAPAPMSSAKQEMIEDNKSDFERWLDQALDNIDTTIGREICSADELTSLYHRHSGYKCSSKVVTLALNKRGIKRLSKQAKMTNGKRIRVYALIDFNKYDAKTDRELGEIIESKPTHFI